jgi:hypothetical protein
MTKTVYQIQIALNRFKPKIWTFYSEPQEGMWDDIIAGNEALRNARKKAS